MSTEENRAQTCAQAAHLSRVSRSRSRSRSLSVCASLSPAPRTLYIPNRRPRLRTRALLRLPARDRRVLAFEFVDVLQAAELFPGHETCHLDGRELATGGALDAGACDEALAEAHVFVLPLGAMVEGALGAV